MALQRHAARHLHPVLARAHEAQEMARADDLVGQLRFLQERALAMLTTAEAQGDRKVALGAMREARANLELSAKLLGELGERATVNVTLTPEWRGVQARVLEALAPYPELRARVAGALIGARSDDGHAGSNGPGPSA